MNHNKLNLHNPHEILFNPLNNSTSKQQYSFSKQKRFSKRIVTEGPQIYYDIPLQRSGKKINFSLGRGHTQSVQKQKAPPPGSYNIESDFDILLKKKYGNHFSLGREQCKAASIFFGKNQVPGPGSYESNPEYIASKISKCYSFRQKLKDITSLKVQTPGPGSYALESNLLNQHKILSTDRKSPVPKISTKCLKTNMKTQQSQPPFYFPKINYRGEKLLSKQSAFSLGKGGPRFKRLKQDDVPGPGYYNYFSEFVSK